MVQTKSRRCPMDKTKHLKTKYSLARFNLISQCSGDELRFYLYVKLYAINQNSAFPSHKSFERDLGWSKYTTDRITKQMEKKKRLKVERSRGKNNIYNITWYDLTNEKSSQETLTTSGRETLTTSRRETLTQTNRNKTIRNKTNKSSSKEEGTPNGVALIRDYFIERCKTLKGFEPEMAFGKEGRLLREKLERYTSEQLKDLIDQFMKSKIGEDLGFTLGICLSAGVINQWLGGKLEKPKKPYYNGNLMCKIQGKWKVFDRGEWLEFADKESTIEWK